jgi:hypothetical protein
VKWLKYLVIDPNAPVDNVKVEVIDSAKIKIIMTDDPIEIDFQTGDNK